jgi:hypothetical protein
MTMCHPSDQIYKNRSCQKGISSISNTAVQKGRASLKLMAEVLLLTILMRKMFLQCDATIASEFFSKNLLPSML